MHIRTTVECMTSELDGTVEEGTQNYSMHEPSKRKSSGLRTRAFHSKHWLYPGPNGLLLRKERTPSRVTRGQVPTSAQTGSDCLSCFLRGSHGLPRSLEAPRNHTFLLYKLEMIEAQCACCNGVYHTHAHVCEDGQLDVAGYIAYPFVSQAMSVDDLGRALPDEWPSAMASIHCVTLVALEPFDHGSFPWAFAALLQNT